MQTNTVPPSARAALTDRSYSNILAALDYANQPLRDAGNGLLSWQVVALTEARCALLAVTADTQCGHTIAGVACPVRLRLIRG